MSSKKRINRDTEVVPHTSEPPTDPHIPAAAPVGFDAEATVDLRGSDPVLPMREDAPSVKDMARPAEHSEGTREHLKGLIQALVFASDRPLKPSEIAKIAQTQAKVVKDLLEELSLEHKKTGIHLDEIAGGWMFRTAAQYAPFVRELTKAKPVRLSRAQVETLAIIAYRQPITRPDIDDIRGVDSGAVLKTLLERDLVRILGKKDEPGRPLLYGTGHAFLELFGLKSLSDLPTLREFTELTEESRRVVERELGEEMENRVEIVEGDEPSGDRDSTVPSTEQDPVSSPEEALPKEQESEG
jgi:segregation and condensation protein B